MQERQQHEPYKVHLADVSYFSGKLEAYLRYKEIPFQRIEMTAGSGVTGIYAHTGIRKVPAVETGDGLWLRETTNMIDWFEDRYTNKAIIPADPALAFTSKLVEDYADEWCWRSAMYWRWKSNDNAQLLGSRIGKEVFADWPIPTSWSGKFFKARQRFTFMKGDGVCAETEATVRDQYFRLSESLTKILSDQPFLLGNQPTLVDFAFMGPFFRHYFCDPIPARIMRDQYPSVLAWVSRVWNAKASISTGSQKQSDFKHTGWEYILSEMMQDYLPYLQQNKTAWQTGLRKFDNVTTQETFKQVPVIHHRVYCLEQLEKQYQSLDTQTRTRVDKLLTPYGDICLTGNTVSGIADTYALPLKPRPKIGLCEYLEAYLLGSPWDMNRPPKNT
jgi:glutathione S-transferase